MDLILDGDDDSKDIALLLACHLPESRHAEPCGRCVTELCGPRDENPTIITSASSGPEQTMRHVVRSADNSRCLWPSTIRTDNPQVVVVHGTHSPNCGHLKTPRVATKHCSLRDTVHCVADDPTYCPPHGNVPASHRPGACIVGRPGTRRAIDD